MVTALIGCAKNEPVAQDPPDRPSIGVKYAATEIDVRQAPKDDAAVVTQRKTGEALSILAVQGDWTEIKLTVGQSGWVHSSDLVADKKATSSTVGSIKFRVPPEPVSRPGVHGVIKLEAQVNIYGDVSGVKRVDNTTGLDDLEKQNIDSLKKAKFYPLHDENGKAQPFVYDYSATY